MQLLSRLCYLACVQGSLCEAVIEVYGSKNIPTSILGRHLPAAWRHGRSTVCPDARLEARFGDVCAATCKEIESGTFVLGFRAKGPPRRPSLRVVALALLWVRHPNPIVVEL